MVHSLRGTTQAVDVPPSRMISVGGGACTFHSSSLSTPVNRHVCSHPHTYPHTHKHVTREKKGVREFEYQGPPHVKNCHRPRTAAAGDERGALSSTSSSSSRLAQTRRPPFLLSFSFLRKKTVRARGESVATSVAAWHCTTESGGEDNTNAAKVKRWERHGSNRGGSQPSVTNLGCVGRKKKEKKKKKYEYWRGRNRRKNTKIIELWSPSVRWRAQYQLFACTITSSFVLLLLPHYYYYYYGCVSSPT